jgi:spermidine synthase
VNSAPVDSAPAAHAGRPFDSGLRRYLFFTAAVTGAAVMIVEILGAKMLSPYLGTSHFVWTAQIAVTLIALAGGYYAGGRMADRTQQVQRLYWAILAVAAWLALTTVVIEPVSYWCLNFDLAVGSLLASLILYFVPLSLLAMTGPFLVRFIASSMAYVGGAVGGLTALSTLGSFGGTLLVGYFLIPWFSNSTTMFLTSLGLGALCGGYFLWFHRSRASLGMLLVLAAVLAGTVQYQRRDRTYRLVEERFAENSHFGYVQVLDRRTAPVRYFLNDNLVQNAYDFERKQSPLAFSYLLTGLPRRYCTNISDVLVVGMGVGIVPMEFAKQGARVDAIEINPAVVDIARRFFDFDPRLVAVTIGDGRHFLNRTPKSYEVVILDAFLGDSAPSHLMTQETFATIRRVLRPGGVVVVHTFGELQPGRDYLLASIGKTLQSVFPGVRLHTNGDGAFFFVARLEDAFASVGPVTLEDTHPDVREEVSLAFTTTVPLPAGSGVVLTDDYNPAEYYDARNRELLRRRLALTARQM